MISPLMIDLKGFNTTDHGDLAVDISTIKEFEGRIRVHSS